MTTVLPPVNVGGHDRSASPRGAMVSRSNTTTGAFLPKVAPSFPKFSMSIVCGGSFVHCQTETGLISTPLLSWTFERFHSLSIRAKSGLFGFRKSIRPCGLMSKTMSERGNHARRSDPTDGYPARRERQTSIHCDSQGVFADPWRRAETPGKLHALSTAGSAMYAPEVRAISDETRLGIRE